MGIFQIITKTILNNIKVHIATKVYMIFMTELKKKMSPLDLDVTHIERCDFHVAQVIFTKTRSEHHFNISSNFKQDAIDCS